MNIFCLNNYIKVTFDDGSSVENSEATPAMIEKLKENLFSDKEDILKIINPEYGKAFNIIDNVKKSAYIVQRGQSFYIPAISELTLPIDFVEEFLKAEMENDKDKIQAYYNFWMLVSLNPDSRVRNNLFWFLKKWGMVISKSGLIVGYRNVDIKHKGGTYTPEYIAEVSKTYAYIKYVSKKNPDTYYFTWDGNEVVPFTTNATDCLLSLGQAYRDIIEGKDGEETVYTDHHSHTFEIRLGHIVTMPREKVDSNQEHTCSSGLICSPVKW